MICEPSFDNRTYAASFADASRTDFAGEMNAKWPAFIEAPGQSVREDDDGD